MGLGLNVFLLAQAVGLHWLSPVAQLDHVGHWVALGGGGLFILLLTDWRVRPYAPLFLTGWAAFIAWYGVDYLPKFAPISGGLSISAATFNTQDNMSDSEQVITIIRQMDADVIALQETSPQLRWRINHELSALYPYRIDERLENQEVVLILSRYPFLETPPERPLIHDVPPDRYLRVVINVYGQPITVYNFHPTRPLFWPLVSYSDELHRYYTRRLLRALEGETNPTLVLCDCNTTPHTEANGWLSSRLVDSHREIGAGLGLTHVALPWLPIFWPIQRIDYVWATPDFAAYENEVWPESGQSDHWPVVARLWLRPQR